MRVLHGMCYSLPAVVMISYLMRLTKSWASGVALTNLLTITRSRLHVKLGVSMRYCCQRLKTDRNTPSRFKIDFRLLILI